MEKIKDFIYEKSDIFFAIIVIVIAVFVVMNSLNGWLYIQDENSHYATHKTDTAEDNEKNKNNEDNPDSTANADNSNDADSDNADSSQNNSDNNQANTNNNQSNANSNQANANNQNNSNSNQNSNNTQGSTQTNKGAIRNITIAPGSTAKSIANALKNNGLITDEKEFVQALINSGNDTKLKAGTFSIRQGSTTQEIISILIKNP